jgi:hypothetical protein
MLDRLHGSLYWLLIDAMIWQADFLYSVKVGVFTVSTNLIFGGYERIRIFDNKDRPWRFYDEDVENFSALLM